MVNLEKGEVFILEITRQGGGRLFTEELKLIKDAEDQADKMRKEAKVSAKKLTQETDAKADKMVEEAFAREREQCQAFA